MFKAAKLPKTSPEIFYTALQAEALALLDRAWFTNLANVSACLFEHLDKVNWVGFYLAQDEELVLGPFQGRPACLRIALGRGVCGAAAKEGRSVLVDDVHAFPGHIACDSRSRSELVIPMFQNGRLLGVLDIDSPELSRFDESDQKGLEDLVRAVIAKTDWPDRFY